MRTSIIRGTTPTIIFKFDQINASDITKAYLFVKQDVKTKIERDLSTATINAEDNQLEWTITQEESLSLTIGAATYIGCDWLLNNETRGRSKVLRCEVEPSGKNEVI